MNELGIRILHLQTSKAVVSYAKCTKWRQKWQFSFPALIGCMAQGICTPESESKTAAGDYGILAQFMNIFPARFLSASHSPIAVSSPASG